MSESLFSTLRIIAMMLSVDQDIHDLERAWFMALMNNFGTRYMQRKTLREDLKGTTFAEAESILDLIKENKDKARLLNFLTVAMHIDSRISPKEKDFYQKIKTLLYTAPESSKTAYLNLGRELLKRDKEMQLWRELGALGEILNMRRNNIFWGWGYPYNAYSLSLLLAWLPELILAKRRLLVIILCLILGFYLLTHAFLHVLPDKLN